MKNTQIISSSILVGCLALTGCGSDSSPSDSDNINVIANPATDSTTLTGLWLQSSKATFSEHEAADPANDNLEAGDFTGSGTGYTIFQLTDNGDGTLNYKVCAGNADADSYRLVTLSNNEFTLPAGASSADGYLPSDQTVTVIDNQNLSFTDFSHSDSDGDSGDTSSTSLSNIHAVKIRDDINSSIGTYNIGQNTQNAFCFDAASLSGTGTNVIDSDGNPEANFSFELNELSVSGLNGEVEIGDAIKDNDSTSNEGWAEYYDWSQGGVGEWSDESSSASETVTFSSDFMSITASGIVGVNDTVISVNIVLN